MRSLKLELKARDLVNRSDAKSKQRSRNLRSKFEKGSESEVYYSVDSKSHPGKENVVIISSPSIHEDVTEEELREILKTEDIKVACSCEAFLYQGYKYITYHNNAGIDPEGRSPSKRNPNKKGMLCKHILAVLHSLGVW